MLIWNKRRYFPVLLCICVLCCGLTVLAQNGSTMLSVTVPRQPEKTIDAPADAQYLKDIPLPEGWEWQDGETLLKQGQDQTGKAIYKGKDGNISAVREVTILIPGAEPATESETMSESELQTEPETEPESDSETESETTSETESETVSQTEAKTENPAGSRNPAQASSDGGQSSGAQTGDDTPLGICLILMFLSAGIMGTGFIRKKTY